MNGTILSLARDKGFGFIRGDDDNKEYFFHRSALVTGDFKDLRVDNRVEFRVAQSPKGPRAEDVEVIYED